MLHEGRALSLELVGHPSEDREQRCARVEKLCPYVGTPRLFLATLHPFPAMHCPVLGMRRAFPAMHCPVLGMRRAFLAMSRPRLATLCAFLAVPWLFLGVRHALLTMHLLSVSERSLGNEAVDPRCASHR